MRVFSHKELSRSCYLFELFSLLRILPPGIGFAELSGIVFVLDGKKNVWKWARNSKYAHCR